MNRRAFGAEGEQTACEYLIGRGWRIVDRNVRIGRGEIDVIARKRGITAFIEVKRRTSELYGAPAEAVNAEKRRRIVTTAAQYIRREGLEDTAVRFDVIEILPGKINHIENAFDADIR